MAEAPEIFAYDIGRSTLRSALPTPPTTRANRKTAITVADLLNEGVFAVCGPGSPPNSPLRVVGSTLCHARGEADPVSGQLPGLRDCTSSLSPAAASTTPSPAMIAVYWSTQGTAARSLVCRRSRRRRHRYPRPVASRLPCYHAGTGAPAPWALLLGLWVANYYSARNPLRLSSLVILGVVARMFRCATRSSCWCT